MSKEFALSFFPSVLSFISSPDLRDTRISFLVDAWDAIFPDEVASLCSLPPQRSNVPQRPCLAIAASLGAWIGFRLGSFHHKRLQVDGVENNILVHSIHNTWSKSLLAFGSMNVVAIMHHCIIPPPSTYQNMHSTRRYIDNILWSADCIFTGVSSIHLSVLVFMLYSVHHRMNQNSIINVKTKKIQFKRVVKTWEIMVHVLMFGVAGAIPIPYQLLYNGNVDFLAAMSTSVELTYIIPVIIAANLLFPLAADTAINVSGRYSRASSTGARIAILGGMLLVGGIALDASLCFFVSNYLPSIKTSAFLNDVYHVATPVFLGCDIAFWGMNMWITNAIYELSAQDMKEL